jgi:hypothetical protein
MSKQESYTMRICVCLATVTIAILCSALISPTKSAVVAVTHPIAVARLNDAQRLIWTGRSGGFTIQWSATDINARRAGGPALFSAKSLAQSGFKEFRDVNTDGATGQADKCIYQRNFTLLSVVGSIISFRDNYYTSCEGEAHPGGETRYTAIDLVKPGAVSYKEEMEFDLNDPGQAVKLTDIFDETDIFNALRNDSLVKEALADSPSQPRSLSELVESFGGDVSDKHCYSVDRDMFTRFAFHHLENGKVAVRLGLSGAGPCRENLTEIGILLPIPPSLKTALAQADAGKEGFLMKDLKKISNGQTTRLSF